MEYPHINFGTYRLAEKTSESLEHALMNGYYSIDTASLYKNESIIGEYLQRNQIDRNKLWLTSKMNPKILVNSPDEIIASINKTLADLKTRYLDLFLIHCPKDEHIIKCWDIMEQFHKQGIFRNIGVSNFDIHHMEMIKAFSTTPIFTNQIEISPFLKRQNVIDYMKKNDILVSAHSSLTKGEKFNDPTITKISIKYGKTPAQIMLKWALQNNYHVIPRSSKKEHLVEDINLDFVISSDDIQELDDIQVVHITHPQYKFI
jgi:diketogulonate reductase-like aldo/keto reductase